MRHLFLVTILSLYVLSCGEVTTTATYDILIKGSWDSKSHPNDNFPSDPHFSAVVGMTHTDATHLWASGAKATIGVKDVAETGSTTAIEAEITDLIQAGTAGQLLQGSGITSTSELTLRINAREEFPYISLMTMLAPSPDWFTGLSSVLLYEDETWVEDKVYYLFAYDAGTDSGADFSSANSVTDPATNITKFSGSPFANGIPLGFVHIKKIVE